MQQPPRSLSRSERQQRYVALALGSGSLFSLVARRSGFHLPWQCPFRYLTGIPCPTCGMTRSLTACLAGHWGEGFSEHAFGPPLLILSLVWLLGWTLELTRNRTVRWMHWAWPRQGSRLISLVAVLLGYHAVRLMYWWQTGRLQAQTPVPW